MPVITEETRGTPKVFMPSLFQAPGPLEVPEMELVENRLREVITAQNDMMRKVSEHLTKGGGKRLRPVLVILSASLYRDKAKDVVDIATASELIHMASLVHDDVIDESDTRHRRPTVNSKWGNRVSILFGDHLFAKAFELLAGPEVNRSIIGIMTRAVNAMCKGEFEQMVHACNCRQLEDDYFRRIRMKTAELIAACCFSGAIAGNLSKALVHSMGEYGTCLGLAFQIVDDILDYTSDADSLGKPTGADLRCGNFTLPLLHALKDPNYGPLIQELLSEVPPDETTAKVVEEMVKSAGGIDYAYQKAGELIGQAKMSLRDFPDSPAKVSLLNIADYVITRVY